MSVFGDLSQLLAAQPATVYAVLFLIGACLGSFVTVVVARLPAMMLRQAEAEARDILGQELDEPARRFDLAWPGSHCPACHHRLRWYENLPILSWSLQRGRCRACSAPVSLRYPALELGGGAAVCIAVLTFGVGTQAIAAAALLLALLAIAGVDLEHQLIPDAISLPMLWLGLLLNAFDVFVPARSAILGAAAGYGALWMIGVAYRRFAGKEALGGGDLKLAGMIGAWIGIGALPGFFMIAFVLGAAIGLGLIASGRARLASAVPFGPFLAAGAAAAILLPWLTDAIGALFLP